MVTLRSVTITGEKLPEFGANRWDVKTAALPEGKMRLKLSAHTNLEVNRSLADTYTDLKTLQKRTSSAKPLTPETQSAVTEYGLAQNYPNPFNPTTQISYQLPGNSMVRLEVFDLLGRKVQTLVNEQKQAGRYTVSFDASHLASGVYIYRLQAGDFTQSKQLFLIK